MGRLYGEVIVKNPTLEHEQYRNERGLIVKYCFKLFKESEYRLIFSKGVVQFEYRGNTSFTKNELEPIGAK
jgi:hypothetical protein